MKMRILGVDPGASATGFGIIDVEAGRAAYVASGVIRTRSKDPLAVRLLQLYDGFAATCGEHQPTQIAVESLFHARSPRTGITLGHARGVLLLVAAQRGCVVAEYSPLEIKQSVTGYGAASKHQVHAMLARLVGAPTTLAHDASDALAVALCHVNRSVTVEVRS